MEESTMHISKKPRLTCDSFDTSTVQVIVGQSKKAFTMDKGILCNVAPYFRAALDGNFLEGVEQVLKLPEEDEVLFRHFQLWVYTKRILEDGEDLVTMSWKPLINLYIFGDKFGIADLQNASIDLLIDKQAASRKQAVSEFRHIYRHTLPGSPLRKLFVDWSVHFMHPKSWFEGNKRDNFPKDFLIDLAIANHELKSHETEKGGLHVQAL